jgi:ABC-type multidrug transport system fused ATPase/permease subunit
MIANLRKLYDVLNPRERRNALILLGMMLVQGLLEAMGVASIVPFMAVLSNPQTIQTNPYLAAAYQYIGAPNQTWFLIFLGLASLSVILARIGISAATSYAIVRYAQLRSFSLSIRLLQNYLSRPYGWFLNRHSADMGKSLLSEVEEVVQGSLMRSFDLAAQLIVSTSLILLVVIAEPRAAIIATSLLGTVYAFVYFSLRPRIERMGRESRAANQDRFKLVQEMFSGIKEVKIGGLEHPYLRRFSNAAHRFARRKAKFAVLRDLPRYLLEAFSMAGIMAILLLLMVRAHGDFTKIVPVMTLYAFAGLRLLPMLQRIYANLVSLRFGSATLDAIHRDMQEIGVPIMLAGRRKDRLPLRDQIQLRDITFTYPKADRASLQDISLTIASRTTVGFVGSTGSGKTTLVDVVLGLLAPQQGELTVDGTLITADNVGAWQQAIGYVPQQIFLADETVAGNIAFGVPPHEIDMKAVECAARIANLHDFIMDELPQKYETKVGERGVRLSGGQRQRVGIARALYHDPDVLVLDEATSALDNLTERAVMDAVHNLSHQKTVLIIAHRLSTVQTCDRLFLLDHGRLKAVGTYDELLKADPAFRRMASHEEFQERTSRA